MKNLKCYVGLDNRFVMCERFPDDEEHVDLDEMLEEWLDNDTLLTYRPLEQGFYDLEFDVVKYSNFNPVHDQTDAHLELTDIKMSIHIDGIVVDKEKYKTLKTTGKKNFQMKSLIKTKITRSLLEE